MNKSANLIMALSLCVLCARSAPAQRVPDPNQPQNSGVQMTLTHLSVTDQTLEVGCKITNNSDHDIWICNSLHQNPSVSVFERFMDQDAETLVIRRRFDLPLQGNLAISYPPTRSRYVRLRPGREKLEFFSLAMSVRPSVLLETPLGNAELAQRLAVEIGFYNEDLPGLILQIVELAEYLNCDLQLGLRDRVELGQRFFGGRQIAQAFNFLLGWSASITSGGDDIWMPHMGQTQMGEKVLRIEVDGLSIPYKSNYPPLVEAEAPTDVTMALTKLDVNDTNLELGWKITNNTAHDVWICSSLNIGTSPSYERFLDGDGKTLMIRRRFGLPIEEGVIWEWPYRKGQYIRLRPGQEKAESLSGSLPVPPNPVFVKYSPDAQDAGRLVLEIGFFNQDLQQLILRIVELAEKICDVDPTSGAGDLVDLVDPFFAGWAIAFTYKIDSTFRGSIVLGEGPIVMPHNRALGIHEAFLRIEVDNVSIPFGIPNIGNQ